MFFDPDQLDRPITAVRRSAEVAAVTFREAGAMTEAEAIRVGFGRCRP